VRLCWPGAEPATGYWVWRGRMGLSERESGCEARRLRSAGHGCTGRPMQPGPRRACATRWTRCSRRRPSARAPAALVRGPGRGPRPRACPVCVGAGIAGASVQHAGCSPACRRCGGPRLALAQGSKPCALCAAPPTAPSSSPAPRAQTARRSTTTTSRTPRARSRCWRRRCRRRCRRPARPRRTPTAPRAAPGGPARRRGRGGPRGRPSARC